MGNRCCCSVCQRTVTEECIMLFGLSECKEAVRSTIILKFIPVNKENLIGEGQVIRTFQRK